MPFFFFFLRLEPICLNGFCDWREAVCDLTKCVIVVVCSSENG